MAPPRPSSSRQKCSNPAGEMISRMRQGWSPALRGLGAVDHPADSNTAEEALLRVLGADDLGACDCRFHLASSFHWTVMLREPTVVLWICQASGDTYVHRNSPLPEEAPRRARGADAQAHHREHRRAANPPPDPSAWAAIEDPEERTEIAFRELYGFYRRTEGMYISLLRDEPLVPILQHLLGGFYAYLNAIREVLMAGRGLRGAAARRTRAAVGHALAFPTWRSLTAEQALADDDAVALMCALVEGSGRASR